MTVAVYLNTEDIAPLKAACRRVDLNLEDQAMAAKFLVQIEGDILLLPQAPESVRCTALRQGVTMAQYPNGKLCDHDIREFAVDLLTTKQHVTDWLLRLYRNSNEIHCGAIAKHAESTSVET